MHRRIPLKRMVCTLASVVLLGGCSPQGYGVYSARLEAEALRAEIEAMTTDLTSTADGDCAVAALACGATEDYILYSRATVDEGLLLEKVRQYNERLEYIAYWSPVLIECPYPPPILPVARSESGVCVAGTR
jgi:hypothetical protein